MTKADAMMGLANFAVETAFEIAKQANGGEIKIKDGRALSVDGFIKYLETTAEYGKIPAMLLRYLTFEGELEFEKTERVRSEKATERARILALLK